MRALLFARQNTWSGIVFWAGSPSKLRVNKPSPHPTPALRLLLTIWLQAGHRGTQDLYLHLIGDAKLHGIALKPHDRAEQSPW